MKSIEPQKTSLGVQPDLVSQSLNELRAKIGLPPLDLKPHESQPGDGIFNVSGKAIVISGGKIVGRQG